MATFSRADWLDVLRRLQRRLQRHAREVMLIAIGHCLGSLAVMILQGRHFK